jgi:hypothetical protein
MFKPVFVSINSVEYKVVIEDHELTFLINYTHNILIFKIVILSSTTD